MQYSNYRMVHEIIKTVVYAIRAKRFVPVFQPVYNAETGEIFAYEALARIVDKNTIIYPDMFMPAAEWGGLTHYVDTMILQRACEAVKDKNARLFVNVHPETFKQRTDFPEIVMSIAQATNMQGRLYLEITEKSKFIVDKDMERKLNDNGIFFIIDDFGADFSNLSYLKSVNAPIVKIDGEFIKNIHTDERDKFIVKHLAGLFNTLGKEVIAEFVENKHIRDTLMEIGINLHQGYYYSKPSFNI